MHVHIVEIATSIAKDYGIMPPQDCAGMASSNLELIDDEKKCVICNDLGEKPITNITSSTLAKQLKAFDNDRLLNLELTKDCW